MAVVMVAAIAAACSKPQSTVPAPVPKAAEPPSAPATEGISATEQAKVQAQQFQAQGEYEKAIRAWKAVVEKEPTADHYNELSYAFIQAKQWPEALAAAEAALKLQPAHKYATYNAGVAALEQADLCKAERRLEVSAEQQSDRYEPYAALARVHQKYGDYPAALRAAQKAAELSQNAPEVRATLAAVESMRTAPAPTDLATKGTVKYQDSTVTVYLYPESSVRNCAGDQVPYTLVAVHKPGKTLRLPIGVIRSEEVSRAALPAGAHGYFFRGSPIGAHVSHSSEYSLWVDNGQELFPVEFHNLPPDKGGEGWIEQVGHVMRSGGVPKVEGNLIEGHYKNDANGYYNVTAIWRLSPDLRTATFLDIDMKDPLEPFVAKTGTAVSVTKDKLVIAIDGKNVEFPTSGFEVRQSGWPGDLANLKPGTKVELALRDGKLLRIEFAR